MSVYVVCYFPKKKLIKSYNFNYMDTVIKNKQTKELGFLLNIFCFKCRQASKQTKTLFFLPLVLKNSIQFVAIIIYYIEEYFNKVILNATELVYH